MTYALTGSNSSLPPKDLLEFGLTRVARREYTIGASLIVEAILKGANPNEFFDQSLPLHSIVRDSRPLELIKLLLDKGANPLSKDPYGCNAFFYAHTPEVWNLLTQYSKESFKEIINKKNDAQHNVLSHLLIMNDPNRLCKEDIHYLIQNGAEISPTLFHEMIELHAPVQHGQILFDLGYRPDTKDLTFALKQEQVEFAHLFVEQGISFEEESWKTLLQLINCYDYHQWSRVHKLAHAVMDHFESLNLSCFGWTPLHFAARCGFNEALKKHIMTAQNLEPVDSEGNTPLSLALKYHRLPCALLLLQTGKIESKTLDTVSFLAAEKLLKLAKEKEESKGDPVRLMLIDAEIGQWKKILKSIPFRAKL